MWRILILTFFWGSCLYSPVIPFKGQKFNPNLECHFYFSQKDFDIQGKDTSRICIVDKGKKAFIYTWYWPVNWEGIEREKQKDEVYLGKGYVKKYYPDSIIQHITLLKFNDLIWKR